MGRAGLAAQLIAKPVPGLTNLIQLQRFGLLGELPVLEKKKGHVLYREVGERGEGR